VAKDTNRPFIVDTGSLTVTAVGTAFDVRLTDNDVSVSVTDGRVRVARQGGSAFDVSAGERTVYDSHTGKFKVSSVNREQATAWRERRLEFVNEPLDVVIANLNRYVNPHITFSDADAGRLTFTGTVTLENFPAWLNALPGVLPIHIERRDGELILGTVASSDSFPNP
jgi:transmembrane sensor